MSSLTSIALEIRNGVMENGRIYAVYSAGGKSLTWSASPLTNVLYVEYGMPRDESELERIDMSHEKYFLLLD